MNDETLKIVDSIINLSTVSNMHGSFVISKTNQTFIGIDIRFDPPLNLDDFPSLKYTIEVLKK